MAIHSATQTRNLWQVLPATCRRPQHLAVEIQGLALDSRGIEPGFVFLAVEGHSTDGRRYIPQAVANGCAAIVAEATHFSERYPVDGTVMSAIRQAGVALVLVDNLLASVSDIAARFYGEPAQQLAVTGVTGTNGKTTCVSLIGQLQAGLGLRSATIGTLGYGLSGEAPVDTGMTTPDAIKLQHILADLSVAGVDVVAMEVSSHSLDQYRADAANITTAVYTNLSRDHLDYHGDEASYGVAKARLFALPSVRTAVINTDDGFGKSIRQRISGEVVVYSYGLTPEAQVYADQVKALDNGLAAVVHTPWGSAEIASPLLGEFNLYNLLAAMTVVCAAGAEFSRVVELVPGLAPVAGRMEVIAVGKGPTVVVDYAHTPDALEKALRTLRSHCRGSLWCVFGCGGDRDRGKRPEMGAVAERYADAVVVTSDNPRSEEPKAIIAEIVAGAVDPHSLNVEADRQRAIASAVERAAESDMILIAGKGHENYQQVGDIKRPFSDRQQAEAALVGRLSGKGGEL
jgi:UDP-N-acetylmuramoyl-L-alanyl-D-glutamate--2,6-diaminopimelate ligase